MTRPALQLSANLSFLFTEYEFGERFERAARAGFRGVEYMFPYACDRDELRALLRENGLQQVLHNLPAGDWAAGERGIACLPGREAEFRESVALGIDFARTLGCRQLNCLAGIAPTGIVDEELHATLTGNLRYAGEQLARHGIRLLIEPINSRVDMPGFWLDTPAKALALIAELAIPNLWLQYDVYHAQVMAGDLAQTIESHIDRIAHIQLADNPGRNEPGSGEINYPFLFDLLRRIGYDGWLGCEYRPTLANTERSLGWAREWLAPLPPARADGTEPPPPPQRH
ncbi:MAG: Hydroxypyruvate isomerase [Accumulibacter sp.]|uniref:hydroxypyruvate isomerase n=1 Tax=Accumulibacter sp. TaxID=2053492 RepID=UPI0011FB4FD5|nr:hydroxypyruvate isomerase [Accumulibacter sp.]QKS29027.1 MAG: hydroxypyruvate isomerase [Candidatus Accumulibacter similis]TLD46260.1 MAG: Hydroxypyruvate isomerase [Accumulibacter sp.]